MVCLHKTVSTQHGGGKKTARDTGVYEARIRFAQNVGFEEPSREAWQWASVGAWRRDAD